MASVATGEETTKSIFYQASGRSGRVGGLLCLPRIGRVFHVSKATPSL